MRLFCRFIDAKHRLRIYRQSPIFLSNNTGNRWTSKNKFEALAENNSQSNSKEAVQEQGALSATLSHIMKELSDIKSGIRFQKKSKIVKH